MERTLTWRQPEAENASDWGGFWLFLTLVVALLKLQPDTLDLTVRFFPFREVTPTSTWNCLRPNARSSALRADERGASCRTRVLGAKRRRTLVRASPLRGDFVVPYSRPRRPPRSPGTPKPGGKGGRSAPCGMTLNARPVRYRASTEKPWMDQYRHTGRPRPRSYPAAPTRSTG